MKHSEIEFTTQNGLHVKIKWVDKAKEYRAFRRTKYEWVDMKLGSATLEPLKKYIERSNAND